MSNALNALKHALMRTSLQKNYSNLSKCNKLLPNPENSPQTKNENLFLNMVTSPCPQWAML